VNERQSFWRRLFGRTGPSSLSQRQEKVLRYVISRIDENVPLQEILREEYVRRNSSRAELEQILGSPEFIEAVRERLGEAFRSEDFKL
jgi:hypothetical protein